MRRALLPHVIPAGAPADAQWERLQAIWSETARNNYRRARQLAEQALAQAQAAP